MSSTPEFRICIVATDGLKITKDRCYKLKSTVPHAKVHPTPGEQRAVVIVGREAHLDEVRAKLGAFKLMEVPDGDTSLPSDARQTSQPSRSANGSRPPGNVQREINAHPERSTIRPRKPYAFLPVPDAPASAPPVWHDGTSSHGRYSGELRCELTNLTPLLVGWERKSRQEAEKESDDPSNLSPAFLAKERLTGLPEEKNLLCPLRLPGPDGRVLLPGESLKGLLRHELGALLGAPMERVKEQRYSYRPNLGVAGKRGRFLEPRMARVLELTTRKAILDGQERKLTVPLRLELLEPIRAPEDQVYLPRKDKSAAQFSKDELHNYRGGIGAGVELPRPVYPKDETPKVYTQVALAKRAFNKSKTVRLEPSVLDDYCRTVAVLLDPEHGHFSSRHPGINSDRAAHKEAIATVAAATLDPAPRPFKEGDLIWVEWDDDRGAITSFGSHYYYRWAYQDTIRTRGGQERAILSPTKAETTLVEEGELAGAPQGLTAARRLFGYVNVDRDSVCKGIGKDAFSQLASRLSINCAVEDTSHRSKETDRFLPPTYLKELGQPKPSAVEHYLQQPNIQATDAERYQSRGSDQAHLRTYGDLRGRDPGGELAGRKFYLDQQEQWIKGKQWEDASADNQANERSTLAIDASKPGAVFRFTLRFRDLDAAELSAVMLALCPNQLAAKAGGDAGKYCSKLGYARPLGWGSVQIQIKELHLLSGHTLDASHTAERWLAQHPLSVDSAHLKDWLALHQRHHNRAGDYPRERAKPKRGAPASPHPEGEIFTYHTNRRTEHTKLRRLRPPQGGTP